MYQGRAWVGVDGAYLVGRIVTSGLDGVGGCSGINHGSTLEQIN